MAEEKSFAYQHGLLTYHELTMKDRTTEESLVPCKMETLQVGSFKREYWWMERAPRIGYHEDATGWKVVQTNLNVPDKPPVEWTYQFLHAPSEHGIYNPNLFGSNLEYRASLAVDASDIMYFWMVCTKDGRGEQNAIWVDEDKRMELSHRPILIDKNAYLYLMQTHLRVLSGEDTKSGDATKLPLEARVLGLKKSLEHLEGFVSAAHSFDDDITNDGRWPERSMDKLVEDYQKAIGNGCDLVRKRPIFQRIVAYFKYV